MVASFLHTTELRNELPSKSDLYSHPLQTIGQFIDVYKRHTAIESEKVAEKRRQKVADAAKRKEFLRTHGVDPGFLTGTWMDKLETVEGAKWKEEKAARVKAEMEGVGAQAEGAVGAPVGGSGAGVDADDSADMSERSKKKVSYRFLGITWN